VNYRSSAITAVVLCLFAIAGTALVAYIHDLTRDRIAANERETLMRKLNVLIPQDHYDNRLFEDILQVRDEKLLGTSEPVTVYRARREGKPVAVVMTPVAPDGYSGSISLLVGIDYDGALSGVRVNAHHETPGLGDYIEEERSDWIYGFDGKSLENPPLERWGVKKDGGAFDQLTGATITPRAIVKAVRKTLLYYLEHRDALYAVGEQAASQASPVQGPSIPDQTHGNNPRGAAPP